MNMSRPHVCFYRRYNFFFTTRRDFLVARKVGPKIESENDVNTAKPRTLSKCLNRTITSVGKKTATSCADELHLMRDGGRGGVKDVCGNKRIVRRTRRSGKSIVLREC